MCVPGACKTPAGDGGPVQRTMQLDWENGVSENANMIPMDGDELPMSQSEFAERIAAEGDPSLRGDWYVKKINNPPAADDSQSTGGQISFSLNSYLDAFAPGELESRIEKFKSRIESLSNADEVRTLVRNTLVPKGWRSLSRPFSTVTIPAWETYLYRVRPKIEHPDRIMTVGDIWTPPGGASGGRLNREGQPILYASVQWPELARQEAGAQLSETFALSCFAVTDDLVLFDLDNMDPRTQLNTRQNRKWRKLSEFYLWAFQHTGSDPNSSCHILPQVLSLDFGMLTPPLIGYHYCSALTRNPGTINVALDEHQAASKLRLLGTTIWKLNGSSGLILKSLVPQRQGLARNTPLIPGNPPEVATKPVM